MMNWHDIHDGGRERYAQRLAEAEHERLFVRSTTEGVRRTSVLRARIGQALIAWGRWIDGRPEPTARYDVEREGAR